MRFNTTGSLFIVLKQKHPEKIPYDEAFYGNTAQDLAADAICCYSKSVEDLGVFSFGFGKRKRGILIGYRK